MAGFAKGPKRRELDVALDGTDDASLELLISEWTEVSARLRRAHRTLKSQAEAIHERRAGLEPTSSTAVSAVSAFHGGMKSLHEKRVQVEAAIEELKKVRGKLADVRKAVHKADGKVGDKPKKSDYTNLGKSDKDKQDNPDDAYTTAANKYQGQLDDNETAAAGLLDDLNAAFGSASTQMRKVTDQPVDPTPGAPGGPGSPTAPQGGPPLTGPHPTYDPPPKNHPPKLDPPPTYDPPPGGQPPVLTPPYDDGPPDDGRLDGAPPPVPTAPNMPGPGPLPVGTPPVSPAPVAPGAPGVPIPGAPLAPGAPGGPAVPIIGPLSTGALGGVRPNVAVPEVPLGTSARTAGPGVLGQGARAGGMGARSGAVGAGGRGAAGRGGVRSGAGSRGAGAAGGRGGRKGKKDHQGDDPDLWDDGSDWIDDEASGSAVLE